MAKTLTLASVDFLPRYKTNSARIRELIQNKAGVMNMQIVIKSGQTKPEEGSEIVYKDGSRFLFGGYVTRISPSEIGEGQLFIYDLEASDYSSIFNNKVARRAYTSMTLKAIVEDLMSTYVDASYGFTTTNVATGPTITSISFDHVSLRKCFEKLSKLTGYVWNTDYEKNLYFRATDTTAAPETITDSTGNFQEITISHDTTQVKNSVTVIGSPDGEAANAPNSQSFTGNGLDRIWLLDNRPASVTSVTINSVSKQVNNKNNEVEGDEVLYDSETGYIWVNTAETTPANGHVIAVTYYPYVDIIAKKEDAPSIAFFSALDGGDGIFEYTIKDTSITTKAEASERALQELDQFADPLVNGQFVTRTSLLSYGSSSFTTHPTTATRSNYTGSVGFTFNVSAEVTVTQFGRLYVSGNTQNHKVNLWISTDTATPIASGTILATSPSDANNFKWVSISPVKLLVGSTYKIAIDNTNGGDTFKDLWVPGATMDSRITNVASAFIGTQSTYPSSTAGAGTYDTPGMKLDQGYFAPGQYVTVNLPTYGISTDSAFLIQEVVTEINEDSATSTTEYTYTVRFGGKLVGVQEFLESLSSEISSATETDTGTDIKTIEFLTESMVAVDSNLSHITETPPFQYGPGGSPQGRWNLSEWS